MREIDLIPGEFYERRQKQKWLNMAAAAAALIVLVNLGGFGVMRQLNEIESDRLSTLRAEKQVSMRQQDRLSYLNREHDELQGKLGLLNGLRGGVAAESLFVAIDRALDGSDVWFRNWRFQRAGVVVDDKSPLESNGYFIVLPKEKPTDKSETWQIKTHMNINGEAIDHSALSRFVSRLVEQPEIHDVRVLQTSLQRHASAPTIDFELAITVAGKPGARS